MHCYVFLHDSVFDSLLWRRITSEKLKLCTTLFDQDFEWLDADPALVDVVMCLLQ